MTRRSCAYATAWQTSSKVWSRSGREGRAAARRSASVRPRMSFIAMNGRPSRSVPRSWTGGMPGCWSLPVMRASSTNREAEGVRPRKSSRRSMRATSRFNTRSRATQTSPIPPRARKASNWYRSSIAGNEVALSGSSNERVRFSPPDGACEAVRSGGAFESARSADGATVPVSRSSAGEFDGREVIEEFYPRPAADTTAAIPPHRLWPVPVSSSIRKIAFARNRRVA